MSRLRKNSPALDTRLLDRTFPQIPEPVGEPQVPRSLLGERLSLSSCHVSLTSSHPAQVGFPPLHSEGEITSVRFLNCLLSASSCRSMPGHLWVRFSPYRSGVTKRKNLCKDGRSPWSPRTTRFAGLTEASAILLPGKCSTWTVLLSSLSVSEAAGRLQFPAYSAQERMTRVSSSTWLLTMASLCPGQLSGGSAWYVSFLRQGTTVTISTCKK